MTVTAADLVRLAWDENLTLAGTGYMLRSPALVRAGARRPIRLRVAVESIAIELAFRRWLDAEAVPYTLREESPVTRPGWPGIRLGGRRVDLATARLSDRHDLMRWREDPAAVLASRLPDPADPRIAEIREPGDLLVWTLVAIQPRRPRARARAGTPPQPACHVWFPPRPRSPRSAAATPLLLSYEGSAAVTVDVFGETAPGKMLSLTLRLLPGEHQTLPTELRTIYALRAPCLPDGTLRLRSSDALLRARAGDWQDLWVHVLEAVLVGWLTVGEYLRAERRARLEPGLLHLPRTEQDPSGLALSSLRPPAELLDIMRRR